jgi:long-chain acyl-CoA synthetase
VNGSPLSAAPTPVAPLLPQLVDYAARQYGDAPFLLRWEGWEWQAISFRQTAQSVHAFARRLVELGVGVGSRVALLSENRPEWGIAYLAILETGAVVVPLDPQLGPGEVAEILDAAGASVCVVSHRHAETLDEAARVRPSNCGRVSLDEDPEHPSLAEALDKFPDASPLAPQGSPAELAVLIFTSGTTGNAKGVMLSHTNILSNVEGVAQTFEFGPTDRFLSVLPLHHTFESTGGFLCPLRVGASIAYARSLKSADLREDMRTSGASILLGVPLLYEKLLEGVRDGIDKAPLGRRLTARALVALVRLVRLVSGQTIGRGLLRPLRERAGMGRVRLLVSGAAALPEDVFWGLMDLGWPVLEGYGLTECSPVVAANQPARPRAGGVGWPLVGVEVNLDSPDQEGNGEIVVRGPNVMLGYHRNPEATAEVLHDGWFHTGDLGRFLRDGRLRITGRIKNMIATAAGKKIYPEEVESHLATSPLIAEVVVAGGLDERTGREEVQAHVLPNRERLEALARSQDTPFDDAFIERTIKREIDQRCEQLAPFKRVKRVFVRRQEFPKTTTGKIRRRDLGLEHERAERPAVA